MEFIILAVTAYFAAVMSGMVGFGGALLLLPFLNEIIGTAYAVPILTIVQLVGNFSRVYFGIFSNSMEAGKLISSECYPIQHLGCIFIHRAVGRKSASVFRRMRIVLFLNKKPPLSGVHRMQRRFLF